MRSAKLGYPVKITVASEREPGHGKLSKKLGGGVLEAVNQRVRSGSGDLEDRSLVVGAALVSGSPEIAVAALNQHPDRSRPVRGVAFKVVERGYLAACSRLVHRAASAGRIPARLRGSIKVTVAPLRRKVWVVAVGVVERERSEFPFGRNLVEDAIGARVDAGIRSIEVAVRTLERRV